MKKIISVIFAFAVCLACSLTAFADGFQPVERTLPLVVDEADLLSDTEEQWLIEKLQSVGDEHECEVAVLTVNSMGGKNEVEFADDFYDYNGYGYGANDDGLLFLLDMGSRTMYITTHGTAMKAVTDYGIESIFDRVQNDVKNGNYYDAFMRYADIVDDYYCDYENGEVYDIHISSEDFMPILITIAMVIGGALMVAFIGTSSMKAQLKTAVSKPAATDYVRAGSLNVIQADDVFLYRNVTKVRIESSSSGGRSGGSSSHRSSSGRSHGGGGRRF